MRGLLNKLIIKDCLVGSEGKILKKEDYYRMYIIKRMGGRWDWVIGWINFILEIDKECNEWI